MKPNTANGESLYWKANNELWKQERMQCIGGFICHSAPAAILPAQALSISCLRVRRSSYEMDYHFLAQSSSKDSWCGDGEVQIFTDYVDRVSAATEARRELVANPKQPVLNESMQETISRYRVASKLVANSASGVE
jgi:hypothetical protein